MFAWIDIVPNHPRVRGPVKPVLAAVTALAMLAPVGTAHAAVAVVFTFDRSDGAFPNGLIRDFAGNLYGTTYEGGGAGCYRVGCGTVFKLAPDGTETVLYIFTGRNGDGAWPDGSLAQDSSGNVYGTTIQGGTGCDCGTVFEVARDGTETVLHAFDGRDGGYPLGSLVRDGKGNLYGTASAGGEHGFGTVFRLAPDGTETVLYNFAGEGRDGAYPFAGLIRDRKGNLYGTTSQGGAEGGFGTVFKLAPDGTETVLYAFPGRKRDGNTPDAAVIEDKAGNLYGTTALGGAHGRGTVFRLAPDGTETVLHSFAGARAGDGDDPEAGLVEDKARNLYGTTSFGGNLKGRMCKKYGCGTVFKLAADGSETVLHAFHGRKDGFVIQAGLIEGGDGQLYGTASGGGLHKCGTVFSLKQ